MPHWDFQECLRDDANELVNFEITGWFQLIYKKMIQVIFVADVAIN